MSTTIPQIDALLNVRSEDEHLEFKEATNNFHFEELVDYCVALANEGGGRMLLGITDKVRRAGWWGQRPSRCRSEPWRASTNGCT